MKRLAFFIIISFILFPQIVEAESSQTIEDEVIYDILVDRFNNGDQTQNEEVNLDDPYAYHGGDIRGIIDKLDHIKELGFTTISLSSIMENAPLGYHGYWITDFKEVNEQFGTMDDLIELVSEAHNRDMKVILELETNYVSKTHPFVNDSEKADWTEENKQRATDAMYWLDDVVKLNQANEDVQAFLYEVALYWMEELDIDGFKLHAADQANEAFLNDFTSELKEKDQSLYILANVLDQQSDLTSLRENESIDAVENYQLLDALNEVFAHENEDLTKVFEQSGSDYEVSDLILIDNKNTARFANLAGDNDRTALTAWQLALTYMYTSPGVPIVYQGSELPMYGPGFPESQHLVLFNSTDPDIEEFHNRMSSIREQFPVLIHGDFEQVTSNEGLSVFKRSLDEETMYIAINNDDTSHSVTIDEVDSSKQLTGLLGDDIIRESDDGLFKISIPRETSEIYVIEDDVGFNWYLIGFIIGIFLLFVFAVVYLSRKQKQRELNKE